MFAKFHTAFYVVSRSVLFLHLQNPNINIIYTKKYSSSRMPKKYLTRFFFSQMMMFANPINIYRESF